MIRLILIVAFIAGFLYLFGSIYALRPRAEAVDDPSPDLPDRLDAEGLAEWMHGRLVDAYVLEKSGWARERAERVEARLQAGVSEAERLRVVVLWIPEVTGFTFGRHVYLSRRLVERVTADDPVAFVVAHELAHHALGHVAARERWIDRFASIPGSVVAAAILDAMRWRYGPEEELEADAYALRLCAEAGYDLRECLRALDVLEADLLDNGAFSLVYGPEPEDVTAAPGVGESVRNWLWERDRGYPPLLERRMRLQDLARELGPAAV
ncbi:MAG TPA: M48 family metalloprotease [Longimicrobium sp.]|nr:M48 family metalloprotease [Longimicrobium sp.]